MRALLVAAILAAVAVVALGLSTDEGPLPPSQAPADGPPPSVPDPGQGPVLLGAPRPPASPEGSDAAPGPVAAGDGPDEAALLRTLYDGLVGPRTWEGALLDEVLANLGREAGLPFDLTPRARGATIHERVSCAVSGAPWATLLDSLTAPKGLEWFVQGGGVRVGLLGEGPQVSAWELDDMARNGTSVARPRPSSPPRPRPCGGRSRPRGPRTSRRPGPRGAAPPPGSAWTTGCWPSLPT